MSGQMAIIGMHPASRPSFDTQRNPSQVPQTANWNSLDETCESIVVDAPIDPLNPELGLHPEAVQDFLGYPLMGRSVALSITWSPSPQSTR